MVKSTKDLESWVIGRSEKGPLGELLDDCGYNCCYDTTLCECEDCIACKGAQPDLLY